jgi:putative membrane protein insertion efficiency factor
VPAPTARVVLVLLRAYKLLVSPQFAGSCRFLPGCADYARDAVLIHGAVYGSWLAARRLARCHPLCAGGHDPVPAKREERSGGGDGWASRPRPPLG